MTTLLTLNNSLVKTTSTASFVSSISDNFTVNPGFSKALYVCTYNFVVNTTSVTYNGISLTNMTALTANGSNSLCWWVLLDPPEGTYTLAANYSGAGGNYGWSAVCLNGVDQTSSVLDTPSIQVIITGSNSNQFAWAGDLPNRKTKTLIGMQTPGGGNFTYPTSFDSFPDFNSRSLLTVETSTVTTTQGGGAGIGLAVYNTANENATYKYGLDHGWSGSVPSYTISYITLLETLDSPADVQMIII
jgi:hypothetical protein